LLGGVFQPQSRLDVLAVVTDNLCHSPLYAQLLLLFKSGK
jgi:hypothetical protein